MLLTLNFLPVAGIGIELKLGEHGDRQQHHPRLWQISKVLSIISPLGRKKPRNSCFLGLQFCSQYIRGFHLGKDGTTPHESIFLHPR